MRAGWGRQKPALLLAAFFVLVVVLFTRSSSDRSAQRALRQAAAASASPAAGPGATLPNSPAGRSIFVRARARPINDRLGWSVTIIDRSLRAVWGEGGRLDLTSPPSLLADPEGVSVTTGVYAIDLLWSEVDEVYLYATPSRDLPEVLCIQPTSGWSLVFIDVNFGPGAHEFIRTASFYTDAQDLTTPVDPR